MKIQSVLLGLTILLSTSAVFADARYSAEVGVQAIARTVVEKKLVNNSARSVIKLALETGKAGFGKMTCDRALGTDHCSFDVFIKDDESTPDAEETLYRLDVRLLQGKVSSAVWNMIAG
jgi:hypothetical protein